MVWATRPLGLSVDTAALGAGHTCTEVLAGSTEVLAGDGEDTAEEEGCIHPLLGLQ